MRISSSGRLCPDNRILQQAVGAGLKMYQFRRFENAVNSPV
jgi:hypothetical protein